MLTNQNWIDSARLIGCDVAAIKAVAEVEGGGAGFCSINGNSQPIILFEPHIFWRQLKANGINPEKHVLGNGDILYEKWGMRPYPSGQIAKWAMLDKAAMIHREAALCSASWGKFQIMGFNHETCGCETIQEFVNLMYAGEAEQLMLFVHFIRKMGLADELKNKRWAAFARGYNGAGYAKNKYDVKLEAAYNKYAAARN